MKDDTRKAFEAAIAKSRARDTTAKQAEEKKLSERQKFESEFRTARDNVVIPALKEIAGEFLEPAGWTCDIQPVEERIAVTCEIYRGDMRAVAGRGRPHLKFSADQSEPKVNIYTATVSHGGPGRPHSLASITTEFVQQQVLTFFQQLVDGR